MVHYKVSLFGGMVIMLATVSSALGQAILLMPTTREGCYKQYRELHAQADQVREQGAAASRRALAVHLTSVSAAVPLWQESDRLGALFTQMLDQAGAQLNACLKNLPQEQNDANTARRRFDMISRAARSLERAGQKPMNSTVRRIMKNSLGEARRRAQESLQTLAQVSRQMDTIRIQQPPPGPQIAITNTTPTPSNSGSLHSSLRAIREQAERSRQQQPSEALARSRERSPQPAQNPTSSGQQRENPDCHTLHYSEVESWRSGAAWADPSWLGRKLREGRAAYTYYLELRPDGYTNLCWNPR